MGGKTPLRTGCLAALLVVAFTGSAQADGISIASGTATVVESAPGVMLNDVSVTSGGTVIAATFTKPSATALTGGAGCSATGAGPTTGTVTCTSAGGAFTAVNILSGAAPSTYSIDCPTAVLLTVTDSGPASAPDVITTNSGGTINAGPGDDQVTTSGPTSINGQDGADTLIATGAGAVLDGGPGDDALIGGPSIDQLFGGAGDDLLMGGAAGDTLNGGADTDTVSYADHAASVLATLGGSSTDGDMISATENLVGTAAGDTLTGDGGPNVLDGGSGSGGDTLAGAGGNDTLIGRGGADPMDGGPGTDLVTYDDGLHTAGVVATLGGTLPDGDTTTQVENLTGTPGPDTLTGTSGANAITGLGAADTINAAAGGADALDGGTGADILTYAGRSSSVTVDLAAGTGADGGTVAGFETVTGSSADDVLTGLATAATTIDGGPGGDTVTGGTASDTLHGGSEDDTLDGAGGLDNLDGGPGADVFLSRTGPDAITGGLGTDTLNFSGSAAVNANLATGTDSDGDALSGVENLVGSSAGDTLTGDVGANVLDGGGGDDTLVGGDGQDMLFGRAGSDILRARDGAIDMVDCGADTDTAAVDAGDAVTACESTGPTFAVGPVDGDDVTREQRPSISGSTTSHLVGDGPVMVTFSAGGAMVGSVRSVAPNAATGAWSASPDADLPEGQITVSVVQTDRAGTTAPATTHPFTVDRTPPQLAIGAVSGDDLTPELRPAITGSTDTRGAADGHVLVTFLSGTTPVGTVRDAVPDAGTGAWSASPDADLPEGSVTVRVTQTDLAGNAPADPVSRTFSVDATPPAVSLAQPAAGATLPEGTVTIGGSANGATTVSITVLRVAGGQQVATASGLVPSASGAFSAPVPLAAGSYTAAAAATDLAGNTATTAPVAFSVAGSATPTPTPTLSPTPGPSATPTPTPSPTLGPSVTPTPTFCTVPKLKGKTLPAARRKLRRSHCRVGKISRPRHVPERKLRVRRTKPRAGRTLPQNARVRLVMRRAGFESH
ncbi:MAG: hypothetical protein QOF76_5437 [Solirubrobacteraceae bacterium]|nr:hypothetical protein [Solirubrobacteraceae bacterium]